MRNVMKGSLPVVILLNISLVSFSNLYMGAMLLGISTFLYIFSNSQHNDSNRHGKSHFVFCIDMVRYEPDYANSQ
jgi:hypothetical protein